MKNLLLLSAVLFALAGCSQEERFKPVAGTKGYIRWDTKTKQNCRAYDDLDYKGTMPSCKSLEDGSYIPPSGDIFAREKQTEQKNPCAVGLPPGIKSGSFSAEELKQIHLLGADLWGSNPLPEHDPYAVFAVKFRNQTQKCLTKIEFEITLSSTAKRSFGQQYTITVQNRLSEPLGPGWGYPGEKDHGYEINVGRQIVDATSSPHSMPELVSWKLTRAWGYNLPSSDSP